MQPESRHSRREHRTQSGGDGHITRRSLVLTGVLLCGTVALVAAAVVHSAVAAQQVRNAAQIDAQEWELRVVQGASVEGVLDELTGDLAAARDLAREVAMEQTLSSTLVLTSDHTGQGEGATSAAALDAVIQRERLAPFFAPEMFASDGDEAGTPPSVTAAGRYQIDPRDPWSAGSSAEWKVVAVAPSERTGEVDVTWLGGDPETGDLYGWAQARYVVDRALFHDLAVGVTTVWPTSPPIPRSWSD